MLRGDLHNNQHLLDTGCSQMCGHPVFVLCDVLFVVDICLQVLA